MRTIEQRVDELEAKWDEHEREHKNLREQLEAELRSKWGMDLKAQSTVFEGMLKRQDGELATIKDETKKQTPILEKASKRLGASAKERRRRAMAEEIYRTWIKRAITAAISIGAVFEFFARVLPALKGH